jgi:gas vesicle protein
MGLFRRSLMIGGMMGLAAGALLRPKRVTRVNKMARRTFRRIKDWIG